ncbi:malectin domain-containing carbohydrate-binding protein [Actomonas aquatica]|uniref:Malectin domain-containing carbohydrate-binding protein n=1 Tax=Actomonas aquatica TaxID=2866162 RepID=A0ABZ1C9X9_9BACT|nr:malectin domain-containing carbohydrate-binding protein [Opitutus sp. WL0086]WRQ88276.1 malectin domain-containing carbohydrate-binding protein [Opitutus sp. WL0086]
MKSLCLTVAILLLALTATAAPRVTRDLNSDWRSFAADTGTPMPAGALEATFDDSAWTTVDTPHNWDRYEGFRQLKHGDRHGTAWYRRTFSVTADDLAPDRRVWLFFEGVGSYATVWVNGQLVGTHAGGLTTFTLDATSAAHVGDDNLLVVQAEHPVGIRDLPWVCGGSERAYGFSEGTQPFGIFRPVHLVVTDAVRIDPFGLHIWNDESANADSATLHLTAEVTNHSDQARRLLIEARVYDPAGNSLGSVRTSLERAPNSSGRFEFPELPMTQPQLWSLDTPVLYTVEVSLYDTTEPARLRDRDSTPFGIRTIRWPRAEEADGRFYLNGEPVFLNGTCDYEHLLGNSHAFSDAQIDARAAMMRAAGYNAFRDAHHPHNLRFNQHWDREGLLWWTQFGAHCWFDNDAFRANFKTLLRDWVRERRNSPSLVLYGLQNESHVPADFAAECTAIIRELDPTSPTQRLVTTCNGGEGTDWNVPQNWTGTYGGDPQLYADDLRASRLFGEYGAWRSLGLHDAAGYDIAGPLSEERMTTLMETKVRLGEAASESAAGHFHWPFTTHMNPGRHFGANGEQLFDGIRPLDHIGPANNKGVMTIWGEPADAFYMYRSHFADPATDPMVYLPLHTWPDRWTAPTDASGPIVVYSNCDEVELFNDLGTHSLGIRRRGEFGTPFRWDDVPVHYNVLYAEGRVNGQVVARDLVRLHHLPDAPAFKVAQLTDALSAASAETPRPNRHYFYRVNCGGPDYTDRFGATWSADRDLSPGDRWGSLSWAHAFDNLDPRFGSQRHTTNPITDTAHDALYQSYRYGRDELGWDFTVPSGPVEVELHFIEPWYGIGGGDATGWRLFDIALNDTTVATDLDLFATAGPDRAVVRRFPVEVGADRKLTIRFPRVAAGQAVISAIAISTAADSAAATATLPPPPPPALEVVRADSGQLQGGLDTGRSVSPTDIRTFARLPGKLLESSWLALSGDTATLRVRRDTVVFATFAFPGSRATTDSLDLAGAAPVTLPLWRGRIEAGDTVDFSGDGVLFFAPERAPAAAQFLELASASTAWTAVGHLQLGASVRGVNGPTLLRLPQNLSDGDLVRAVSAAATGPLQLRALDFLEVHAVPLGDTAPVWFETWQDSRAQVTIDGRAPIALRRLRLDSGATLELPASPDRPYALIARAVRPATSVEPEKVTRDGAAELVTRTDSSTALLLPVATTSAVEWPLELGAGDRYGLVFSYQHAYPEALTGTLLILDRDGAELRRDPISFDPTGVPSSDLTWSIHRTRTGRSLNAGSYRLRLELDQPSASLLLGALLIE